MPSCTYGVMSTPFSRVVKSYAEAPPATDNDGTTDEKRAFPRDSAKFRKCPIIPVQTSVCTYMFLSVPELWTPSQGGDHRFESGTGYHRLLRAPSGVLFVIKPV